MEDSIEHVETVATEETVDTSRATEETVDTSTATEEAVDTSTLLANAAKALEYDGEEAAGSSGTDPKVRPTGRAARLPPLPQYGAVYFPVDDKTTVLFTSNLLKRNDRSDVKVGATVPVDWADEIVDCYIIGFGNKQAADIMESDYAAEQ